jgi:hypothetical protein
MLLTEEEIRYPEKGDKFFIEDGSPDEIAWLNKTFEDLGSYADSYQTGALTLLNSALVNKDLRDYNIYPAVFLIRHYLELRLKEFIQGLNYHDKQSRDFPKHHDLQNLWSEFKASYSSIFGINDKKFSITDALIKELSAIDPISMSFRYPVDKEGTKTQKLSHVSLVVLKETFIRLSFFIDDLAMEISGLVEVTEFMRQEVYDSHCE